MPFIRIFNFSFILLLGCIGCTPTAKQSNEYSAGQVIVVDEKFNYMSLNTRVLVSTSFPDKDLTRIEIKDFFLENKVEVNQKEDGILMGSFRKYPDAWFYAQLVNASDTLQRLVVGESLRIRCDDFEVYGNDINGYKKMGSVARTITFSNYPLPYFTFAVPFTVLPRDTLDLLVHTKRHYGGHEVNLGLYSFESYTGQQNVVSFYKVFQVIILLFCAIVMFILGKFFSFKSMTYLSLYILSVLFMLLTSWGFSDGISSTNGLGLSKNNVSTFAVLVSCILVLPFLTELMKNIPKNEFIFKIATYTLLGLNLFGMLCFLTPELFFEKLYQYIDLSFLMLISAFFSISWIFINAIFAIYKARVYYIFIGFGFAFIPIIIEQLNFMKFNNFQVFISSSHSTFIFIAIGLSIVTFYLLSEKLISRKKFNEELTQMRVSMEEIRKGEVASIGRNLHDNVGNLLASALGYLNLQRVNKENAQNLIKDALTEIRFLSHNLVKYEDMPLIGKIERLIDHFNEFSSVDYSFFDYSSGAFKNLTAEQQTNLYYILQELFTNIHKHAYATEVAVQLFEDDNRTWMSVEDDGIGMKNNISGEGIGLKNIEIRAKLAGFKVITDSSDHGTNTTIELTT